MITFTIAEMAIGFLNKNIKIKNLQGEEFIAKYGHKYPLGVKGRNSNNRLYREKMGWEVSQPLREGITKTYNWISKMVDKKNEA